jgi:hypothetical protein
MAAVMSRWRLSSRKNNNSRTKLSWKCIILFLLALVAAYVSLLFRLPITQPAAKEAGVANHLYPKNQPRHHEAEADPSSRQDVEPQLGIYKKVFDERMNHNQPNQDDNTKNPSLLVPTKDDTVRGSTDNTGSVVLSSPSNGNAVNNDNHELPAATIHPTNNNEINYSRLKHTEFYNIPSDGTNLWDDPSQTPKLPSWMQRYFNWHKHKRQTWSPETFNQERWLIMQCLAGQDRKCGGVRLSNNNNSKIPWLHLFVPLGIIRWCTCSHLFCYFIACLCYCCAFFC